MSGGKGGSTTSSVEVPQYIEDAARRNLERADLISKIGYVPYFGPDVAAFTPQQEAAFAGTQQLAGAFGTPTAANIGVGAPQTFAGGVRGYSSAPMFEQAQYELGRRRPAQKAFIDSLFIDPYSGAYGSGTYAPPPIVIDDGTSTDISTGTSTDTSTGTSTGIGTGTGISTVTDDGVKVVDLGGTDFAIGGTALDLAGQPVDSLTDQELNYLADLGLAGTVDFGLNNGTTFVPTGFDGSEQDALRSRIEATREIERSRNRERASGYGAQAASTGQSVADVARAVEAERDQRFGVTRGGTATQYAGGGVADYYDPRAGAFGQATATDIGEGSFTADLTRSLTDPNYDPEGTVLSRALGDFSFGSIFGPPTPEALERSRNMITTRGSERRAQELSNLIADVGGQAIIDSGVDLEPNQMKSLGQQFGALSTNEVAQQASVAPSIEMEKNFKDDRKILEAAAKDGNLGAVADSFIEQYGITSPFSGELSFSRFQEKTGIDPTILKDLEKIAAAKG